MTVQRSFDIFETLLVRMVGDPTSVFYLLGQARVELLGAVSASAFRYHRIVAERSARAKQANFEVSLEAIYQELTFALEWSADTANAMMQAEMDLEASLLRAVPGSDERLRRAREACASIWFLSDMYLPSTFLREQLVRHGFWLEGDRLWVSHEAGASKAMGGLFGIVQRELSEGVSLEHSGNDPISDDERARAAGCRVRLNTSPNLNPHERRWEDFCDASQGASSLLAGAARLARLEREAANEGPKGLVDSTAGVAAPVLVAFVTWVLRQANAAGLQRLYFLSRDGQVFLEIARRLLPRLGLSIDLHYLYGGRKAWYPARGQVDDFYLDFLLEKPHALTLRMVAGRAGVELDRLIAETSLEVSADAPLGEVDIARLREELGRGPLLDCLLEAAAEQRRLTMDYLAQSGLDESVPSGLVDVGWTGKTIRVFNELLASAQWPPVQAYLFGLMRFPVDVPEPRPRGWLFDEEAGVGFLDGAIPSVTWAIIIENFCAGDHGSVRGYERRDGQVVPVLSAPENTGVFNWGQPVFRRTVYACAEAFAVDTLPQVASGNLRAAAKAAIDAFYQSPTPDEAAVWLSFPVETDPTGAIRQSWGRPYTLAHAWHILCHGYLHEDWTLWQAGSWAATSRSRQLAVTAARRLRKLTARARSLVGLSSK